MKIDTLTNNTTQDLRLFRQDDVVGQKMLIYAYDEKLNDEFKQSRLITHAFFTQVLGFKKEEFIRINRNELYAKAGINLSDPVELKRFYKFIKMDTWK